MLTPAKSIAEIISSSLFFSSCHLFVVPKVHRSLFLLSHLVSKGQGRDVWKTVWPPDSLLPPHITQVHHADQGTSCVWLCKCRAVPGDCSISGVVTDFCRVPLPGPLPWPSPPSQAGTPTSPNMNFWASSHQQGCTGSQTLSVANQPESHPHPTPSAVIAPGHRKAWCSH